MEFSTHGIVWVNFLWVFSDLLVDMGVVEYSTGDFCDVCRLDKGIEGYGRLVCVLLWSICRRVGC